MEYFIVYGIGFLMGAICVVSAELVIEKRIKKKKNEKTF